LDLDFLLEQLSNENPEEVFGLVSFEEAKKNYIRMSKAVHPDKHMKNENDREKAEECFKKLNSLWLEAQSRFKNGIYGSKKETPKAKEPTIISTKKAQYRIVKRIHSGGTAGVFRAVRINKKGINTDVLLKVPHSPKDNDLMRHEVEIINSINTHIKTSTDDKLLLEQLSKLQPPLFESIKVSKKQMNVFEFSEDCYDLVSIHKAYNGNVDPRVVVFIFNRILNCLMVAHNSGYIHGAVRPNHMIIHKPTHCGCLIDWTCSRKISERTKMLPYFDKEWENFMAPEVVESKISSIKGDLYSAAMCACYLLSDGADLFDIEAPEPIKDVLNLCLQPKIKSRPMSAEEAFGLFENAAYKVFGKPKFVELEV